MTVESLMQMCERLGIKLMLAGDAKNRLQVDAPKGALTQSIRDELTAHKLELVIALRAKNQAQSQVSSADATGSSDDSVTKIAEPRRAMSDQQVSTMPASFGLADVEVDNLLAGRSYDVQVIEGSDPPVRQMITAKLLAALSGRDAEQQERARLAFLDHGYFDEATRDLRTADSPTERAAAARKLGSVGSRVATAHLIAALFDSAPEVRRAAVESLGQLADPAAIAPLNDLLARQTSRQVPESVVRHSIHAIAAVKAVRPADTFAPVTEAPAPQPLALVETAPAVQTAEVVET